MRTYRDPKTLLQALNDDLGSTLGVVAIDGVDGSGKSTLARTLAEPARWTVLHLDNYLHRDQGTYVQHLDAERLSKDVRSAAGIVLVEGVCVLAALERIAEPARSHIYVKHLGSYGNWLDEEESCFECTAEQKIAELSQQVALFAKHSKLFESDSSHDGAAPAGLTEFRAEVIRYHAAYRPFDRATYVYERVDTDA